MIALLRWQAVLAWRTLTGIPILGGLAALAVFAPLLERVLGLETRFPITMFLVTSTIFSGMLVTIASTLNGLEAVRWTTPYRSRLVLRSYVVFWILVATTAGIAMLPFHSPRGLAGPAGVADSSPLLFLLSTIMLGVGLAAVGAIADGVLRRPSAGRVVVAIVAILWTYSHWVSVALIPIFQSADLVLLPMSGVYCLVAVAAASWVFSGVEHSPRQEGSDGRSARESTGTEDAARPAASNRETASRPLGGRGLPVMLTLLRSSWHPLISSTSLLMAIVMQPMFVMNHRQAWIGQLWIAIAVLNLGRSALHARRWTLSTPLSAAKAFRAILLPVFLVAVVAAATCWVASELLIDADVIYRPSTTDLHAQPRGRLLDAATLQAATIDDARGRQSGLAVFPGVVVRHLREEFGVALDEGRVREAMSRAWPAEEDLSIGVSPAVVDLAMERVQWELSHDLWAAYRMELATRLVATLLLTLVLLRMQCGAVGPERAWVPRIAMAALVMSPFLLLLITGWRPALLIVDIPPWALGAALIASVPLGALLIRSWCRAFSRMEWTDFPADALDGRPGRT